jgi:hypothetical protein
MAKAYLHGFMKRVRYGRVNSIRYEWNHCCEINNSGGQAAIVGEQFYPVKMLTKITVLYLLFISKSASKFVSAVWIPCLYPITYSLL